MLQAPTKIGDLFIINSSEVVCLVIDNSPQRSIWRNCKKGSNILETVAKNEGFDVLE